MSFFGDLLQGRAAQQAANYNASLLDRDAKIKEQKGKQGYAVYTNYELPKFNDSADKIIGGTFGENKGFRWASGCR